MKLLLVLAVLGAANCASLGRSYLELETNAAGQITDVDVEQADAVFKSVAVHAAVSPAVTSYAATSPVVTSYAATHSFGSAIAPAFYNLPATNLVYSHSSPIVYRAPTPLVYRVPTPVVYQAPAPAPVVYHAPAPAPVVVQAPPQVIVKTVQAPAPEPKTIIRTVYVDNSDEEDDTPTLYTAAENSGESDEDSK